MRVVAGKYRGLNLAEFKGRDIRPTADRVKESLFDILGARVAGAHVLDLFCGSGSLGIEAISRGADKVWFNDLSKESLAVLKKNLAKINAADCTVTNLDYSLCLARAGKFDIVFIDPPYAKEYGADALKIISENKYLTADGVAVYERDRSFSENLEGLELFDERKYGKTYLSFFKLSASR